MKLLHFLIIIIPIISSIIVGIYITSVPATVTVHPLTMSIMYSRPYALHQGDIFALDVSVYNPNSFPIYFKNIVLTTSFDKNAIYRELHGCSSAAEEDLKLAPLDYTYATGSSSCSVNIANSTGETNATVHLQYKINGKQYNVNASKIITILPKT